MCLPRRSGSERFLPLRGSQPETAVAGDYFDASGEVPCRLEVRRRQRSRLSPRTRERLFVAQGSPAVEVAAIEAALAQLAVERCGARGRIGARAGLSGAVPPCRVSSKMVRS